MRKLKFFEVTCRSNPKDFDFKTTKEVSPLEGTIGQDRALNSIEIALNMKTKGFNIYLAGPRGIGKTFTIKAFLSEKAAKETIPEDIIYVYNFKKTDSPRPIILKTGKGKVLAKAMESFSKELKDKMPQLFEGEEYDRKRLEIISKAQKEKDETLHQAQNIARTEGFLLQMNQQGVFIVPTKNGTPLSADIFQSLPDDEKKVWEDKYKIINEEVGKVIRTIKKIDKELSEKLQQLDADVLKITLNHLLLEIRTEFSSEKDVLAYLLEVEENILNNIIELKTQKDTTIPSPTSFLLPATDPYSRYQINLVVDNSYSQGAPVIFENNPTYYNLIGRIEFKSNFGVATTSFDLIKAGSLLKANGGYLVIQASDVLRNPFSWEALKKSLNNEELIIENIGEQLRIDPVVTLKPEPIPLKVEVILMGSLQLYYLLYYYDEDFKKLFKIRADFDTEMVRNTEHIKKYASFIRARVDEENLNHFDKNAVAVIVDYGSRLAENQEKLSTKFSEIADIISEANYWASREGSKIIKKQHVEKAMEEKIYRSNLIEMKIQEFIENGTILLDTTGAKVGQVNGISILTFGDYSFGKPTRITASVSLGSRGIVNIEREVEMSGRLHSKGVMIVSGYLRELFAKEKPLSLTATLVFEQLYEEIEGDSASSAELYALLSAISGIPLKQNLAVTGSVNQKGEIQPIGGVTKKIEGFFDACKVKGLTGDQGVIIPHQNIKNLVLKEEVVNLIKKSQFHIYSIKNINEGIELLTDVRAGEKDTNGNYPEGTVYHLINKNLTKMADLLKGREEKEKTPDNQ